MKLQYIPTILLAMLITTAIVMAENREKELSMHLKPFAPYLGKTWKGEFVGSTPEKPIYDIIHWERALNGKAIRILHSVNDVEYGGESIAMWDPKKKQLVGWYFTTAGFFTQGIFTVEKDKLIYTETVMGNQNGITEVKSITKLLPDGMHTKSEYLKNGTWVRGHEIHYKEAPEAKVIFK